jgi:hypothetical protein
MRCPKALEAQKQATPLHNFLKAMPVKFFRNNMIPERFGIKID